MPTLNAPDTLINRQGEILALQPEGKRPMSLAAFRNGHRWEASLRVEAA